jgi:glycosyltransferase involved in cell wall biosynthesis
LTPAEPATCSVVVPVYRNRDSIPELVARLEALQRRLPLPLEAVFVVDGSPDDSEQILRKTLGGGGLHARLAVLSRNFGSFSAIRVGLAHARGDYVAVMAADLQEPVEVVEAFFALLAADECDVAIGKREGRNDPTVDSLSSRAYWNFYRRFVNPDFPPGGVDVFGCTRAVAVSLTGFSERHTSLVGLLFWLGYRRRFVPYERAPRLHGRSGWTVSRKLRYLFDSVYAFTDLPILLLQAIGAVGLVGSILFALVVLVAYVMGQIHQAGYTPLIITILASTSALLIGLGVVGSYVWRAYENGQGRPVAVVASLEEFNPDGVEPSPVREVNRV